MIPSLNSINNSFLSLWGTHILLLFNSQSFTLSSGQIQTLFSLLLIFHSFFISPLNLCLYVLPPFLMFYDLPCATLYPKPPFLPSPLSPTPLSPHPPLHDPPPTLCFFFLLLLHHPLFLPLPLRSSSQVTRCEIVHSRLSNAARVTSLGWFGQFIKVFLSYYLFPFEISKSPLLFVITVYFAEDILALVGTY